MKHVLILTALILSATAAAAQEVVLKPEKDTFGRSNQLNKNNGASPLLLVSGGPNIKSVISFDLSSVTNEIVSAQFTVHMLNTNSAPISLVVAPMVNTTNNADWVEGTGVLGIRGRNARLGEATFAWRGFRDRPWEAKDGKPLQSLMDSGLWKSPVATLPRFQWSEHDWIVVPINDIPMLEKIRTSEVKILTFGLWGTAGNGIYEISSKESPYAPRLILVVKEKEDEDA